MKAQADYDIPAFSTWQRENLDRFAHEAYIKLQEQDAQLEQLRLDLKTAQEAYRKAWAGGAP